MCLSVNHIALNLAIYTFIREHAVAITCLDRVGQDFSLNLVMQRQYSFLRPIFQSVPVRDNCQLCCYSGQPTYHTWQALKYVDFHNQNTSHELENNHNRKSTKLFCLHLPSLLEVQEMKRQYIFWIYALKAVDMIRTEILLHEAY
jgi:hypothetical protein